jgi:hypothetical protein
MGEEYLNDLRHVVLSAEPPRSTAFDKCLDLFLQMAQEGSVSKKRWKFEFDQLYAFRLEINNVQHRFPCFVDGNRWVITHGFPKPGAQNGLGKWPPEEKKRATDIRREYHGSV